MRIQTSIPTAATGDRRHYANIIKGESEYEVRFEPRARDHKAKIFTWWFWWPASVLQYVFMDFIRNIFNWIFQRISGLLDYRAKARFKHYYASVPESMRPEALRPATEKPTETET